MVKPTIKLRGHHLLCILPYVGKGYTETFTKTFDDVVRRINNGAIIELVSGVDDICRGLHDDAHCAYADKGHCFEQSATNRDESAINDINKHMGINLAIGASFTAEPEFIQKARNLFRTNQIRTGCHNCQWHGICTEISTNHYDGVKLFPVSTAKA